nr:MAG TPA: hypothetical protein [Bacteriophage sp.]
MCIYSLVSLEGTALKLRDIQSPKGLVLVVRIPYAQVLPFNLRKFATVSIQALKLIQVASLVGHFRIRRLSPSQSLRLSLPSP